MIDFSTGLAYTVVDVAYRQGLYGNENCWQKGNGNKTQTKNRILILTLERLKSGFLLLSLLLNSIFDFNFSCY